MNQYKFTLEQHELEGAQLELSIKTLASIQAATDTIIEMIANGNSAYATERKELFDRRTKANAELIMEDITANREFIDFKKLLGEVNENPVS